MFFDESKGFVFLIVSALIVKISVESKTETVFDTKGFVYDVRLAMNEEIEFDIAFRTSRGWG